MRRLLILLLGALLVLVPGALARGTAGPTNTSPPTVDGTPKLHARLSSTPGTWAHTGTITFAYAWFQCDPTGGNCHPLPYKEQTIDSLQATVGQTVRVQVTATDSTGSASAFSAPATVVGALKLKLVSPHNRAIVHTRKLRITIRVTGATGPVTLRLGPDQGGPAQTQKGRRALFHFRYRAGRQGGWLGFEARAKSGSLGGKLQFKIGVEPPRAAVQQNPGGAPGCATCLVRDQRRDDRGSGPDLASASSRVSGGRLTLTIKSYGPIRNAGANQGHPAVTGFPVRNGPTNGICIGCGSHRDFPARISYPNAHTIAFHIRLKRFHGAVGLGWQVWVLYPGDQLKDTIPSGATLGNSRRNCFIFTEFKSHPPGAYEFERNRCSQKLVVTAKP